MMKPLMRTPLYAEHVAAGARLEPFADYIMPVHYPAGITAEHHATRNAAGLFDVSHMGEIEIRGRDAYDFLQYITINDIDRIDYWQAQYSALPRKDGNLLDDILIYRRPDSYMLVVNAANREKDFAWMSSFLDRFDVKLTDRSDELSILALQGPRAVEVLSQLTDTDLNAIDYYRFVDGKIDERSAMISRTGYTGEDGFELYVDNEDAAPLWSRILDVGREYGVLPAGLGARDTLRLEMGYPLYGNDLNEDRNPFEAGLGWITKLDKGEFVGRTSLIEKRALGIEEYLIGFRMLERGFPRRTYHLADGGIPIGGVTSGTVSPTLGIGIGLAYVTPEYAKPGTRLDILIRDRAIPVEVVKPPFYTEGSLRR